ncbi:DUF4192 family protein [Phytoactinopolyspora endophytica]|uniref:DUF4192 family protein n=1 Tax=Phytoactinopolyspora endophytica TaxID=1642495 RepID=UPI00101BE17B|nr:DUF4192 family protein [Phytoactinopolyspora endophytica]
MALTPQQGRCRSVAVVGVDGHLVDVEARLAGEHGFDLHGLPGEGTGAEDQSRQRFQDACAKLSDEVCRRGADAVRRDSLRALHEMRDRFLRGDRDIDDADVIRALAGLEDTWVRDTLVTWGLEERGDEIRAFLTVLAQHAVDGGCAAICTVLAAVAYQHGHGALALVALQRALRAEPEYLLALLLDSLLDAQVNPREIRAMAQRVLRELIDRGVVRDVVCAVDLPAWDARAHVQHRDEDEGER